MSLRVESEGLDAAINADRESAFDAEPAHAGGLHTLAGATARRW